MDIACLSGTWLRRISPVFLVFLMLPAIAAAAFAESLEVAKMGVGGTDPDSELVIDHELSCSDGSAPSGLELHWYFTSPASLVGLGPIEKAVMAPTGSTVLLSSSDVRTICAALSSGPALSPSTTTVRGLVYAVGTCDGSLLKGCPGTGEGGYEVELDILCGGDVEELHGPSTTGGKGPPEEQLRVELAQLDGELGGTLSALYGFGDCDRQAVEVSLGLQGDSSTGETPTDTLFLGRAVGELGLFPARGAFVPGERGDPDLDLTLVDVSYVRFLRPQTRRLVPELAIGVGWAFADAKGPEPGRGLADDSLTVNAAFRLRFNLDRYGGRYVYFGARSHWFEAREDDQVETQATIGLGFGLPAYREYRWAR